MLLLGKIILPRGNRLNSLTNSHELDLLVVPLVDLQMLAEIGKGSLQIHI